MTQFNLESIEDSLLNFRKGRRLVLAVFMDYFFSQPQLTNPFLLLSRMFCRLKSADSIVEKINRKKIEITGIEDIPKKIPDVLGIRIITDNPSELALIDRFITQRFDVAGRVDNVQSPGTYGQKEIFYKLLLRDGDAVYPFEVQTRTFLQHYWAVRSFHLFHKQPPETAAGYSQSLTGLSSALHQAESVSRPLVRGRTRDTGQIPATGQDNREIYDSPLLKYVHLYVIGPGETFEHKEIVSLSGEDAADHRAIVERKTALYEKYPGFAVVECSCAGISAYLLNEPHIHVPAAKFNTALS